jgi:hypothetical protein
MSATEAPNSAPSAIVGLFFWRRPTAIAGLVISIVVDAVDSQTRRRLAHIGEKALELTPSFANSDASTAIAGKSNMMRVGATFEHSRPASVAGCLRAVLRMAVFQETGVLQTAAASGASAPEVSAPDAGNLAAIAQAGPTGETVVRAASCLSDQSPKTLTRNIA